MSARWGGWNDCADRSIAVDRMVMIGWFCVVVLETCVLWELVLGAGVSGCDACGLSVSLGVRGDRCCSGLCVTLLRQIRAYACHHTWYIWRSFRIHKSWPQWSQLYHHPAFWSMWFWIVVVVLLGSYWSSLLAISTHRTSLSLYVNSIVYIGTTFCLELDNSEYEVQLLMR